MESMIDLIFMNGFPYKNTFFHLTANVAERKNAIFLHLFATRLIISWIVVVLAVTSVNIINPTS